MLRPLANPLPLGFVALAVATLLVAALQLGWLGEGEGRHVAIALLAFVFPLQLLASVLGFLARDVVAGTGMGILAGTWLTVSLVTLDLPPGATSDSLGVLLLAAAAAILIPAAGAGLGKLAAAAVLTTTAVRFAATGIYELTAAPGWADIAGIVGLVLCAIALYTATGMALADLRDGPSLPLGRRGAGLASMRAGLDEQLEGVEHEAGVRDQL